MPRHFLLSKYNWDGYQLYMYSHKLYTGNGILAGNSGSLVQLCLVTLFRSIKLSPGCTCLVGPNKWDQICKKNYQTKVPNRMSHVSFVTGFLLVFFFVFF